MHSYNNPPYFIHEVRQLPQNVIYMPPNTEGYVEYPSMMQGVENHNISDSYSYHQNYLYNVKNLPSLQLDEQSYVEPNLSKNNGDCSAFGHDSFKVENQYCPNIEYNIKEEASVNFNNSKNAEKTGLSFRKNSLKFCRRLCKSLLSLLLNSENKKTDPIFQVVTKILKTQIMTQRIDVVDKTNLVEYHKKLLGKIWSRYKNIFSNYKNSKICLVTFDEWKLVFSPEGFINEFDMHSNKGQEIAKFLDFRDDLDQQLFVEFYKKIILTTNKVLINFVIFGELVYDKELIDKVSNIEDFALMTNVGWMYKHYNHSKGKFALECCNKCKICRSSSLRPDYLEQLSLARENIADIKTYFALLPQLRENSDEYEEQIMLIFNATPQ